MHAHTVTRMRSHTFMYTHTRTLTLPHIHVHTRTHCLNMRGLYEGRYAEMNSSAFEKNTVKLLVWNFVKFHMQDAVG